MPLVHKKKGMTYFMDINNIKSKAEKFAVDYSTKIGLNALKNKFGKEIMYRDSSADRAVKTLSKLYKCDKYLDKVNAICVPSVSYPFIIKIDYHTFIFVSGNLLDSMLSNDRKAYIVKLYFFGKNSYREFKRFDKEYNLSDMEENFTDVYSVSCDGRCDYNCTLKRVESRNFNTLYFDNGLTNSIKKHLRSWLATEPIFKDRGIIFKTGILLHGKPGTGKSSIAAAVADYLRCSLITIDMSTFNVLDTNSLSDSINTDKKRYVILLDEIDTLFKNRDSEITDEQNKRVSKLLSFLDSVNSPSNVVFIATTNYYERLDPAVIRAGRFDKVFEIDGISKETAYNMCKGFKLDDASTEKLLSKYSPDDLIIPATLQADIVEELKLSVRRKK